MDLLQLLPDAVRQDIEASAKRFRLSSPEPDGAGSDPDDAPPYTTALYQEGPDQGDVLQLQWIRLDLSGPTDAPDADAQAYLPSDGACGALVPAVFALDPCALLPRPSVELPDEDELSGAARSDAAADDDGSGGGSGSGDGSAGNGWQAEQDACLEAIVAALLNAHTRDAVAALPESALRGAARAAEARWAHALAPRLPSCAPAALTLLLRRCDAASGAGAAAPLADFLAFEGIATLLQAAAAAAAAAAETAAPPSKPAPAVEAAAAAAAAVAAAEAATPPSKPTPAVEAAAAAAAAAEQHALLQLCGAVVRHGRKLRSLGHGALRGAVLGLRLREHGGARGAEAEAALAEAWAACRSGGGGGGGGSGAAAG
ncbi:hypothetical protein JKP88DRAFT_295702 [Tribonema minus]|uniref:Uncharacterized protein n=1 Tax=Tribonema minus TaxID=303371 RepID=A0A836CQ53_9STRA|nr:hypothetical protein JKP88DRAFT_295702 [Tribonema minus]